MRSLICFISNEYDKIKCFFKKSVVGLETRIFRLSRYPIRTHTHTRGNSVAHVCLSALGTSKLMFKDRKSKESDALF